MKSGYNQPFLINNNINNNQIISSSGKKRPMKNIDNNFDSEEENDEPKNKINNDKNVKKSSLMSDNEYKNMANDRIKKFNLNREKNPEKKVNMKITKNENNNINYNKGYSEEINNKHLFKGNIGYSYNNLSNNNNYSNYNKRSFSGEKNFKPLNHFNYLQEEKKYNSINRITTSYNSKIRNNKNMQSNYAPTNANTKVIKIQKNILEDNNNTNNSTNLYPSFDDDNNKNNYFSDTFNPNLNIGNVNNFYPNQTQSFNKNNINNINPSINNFNNANSNSLNPSSAISNINRITPPDYGLSRGNNTIGYLSHRKDNSNSNLMPFSMPKPDDDDDDGRFHELSITKNFSRFNKSNPFSNTMNFEQVLKQQNQNTNNIKDSGRRTFIKKLPPENSGNSNLNINNINPFKGGISGPIINNQINRSISNNINNIGDNNAPRMNSFGNNINIKKISSGIINNNNNINNSIGLPRANIPNNNIIPNAATFNPHLNNLNEFNKSNNVNPNPILASRNINLSFYPQGKPPIMNNPQSINNPINNQMIKQVDIFKKSASPENLSPIMQVPISAEDDKTQEENNIPKMRQMIQNEEVDENNKGQNEEQNIEQNVEPKDRQNIESNEEQIQEPNEEENIEPNQEENEEQNIEQNEENEESQNKKDPNISYNEFDFSGLLKNYGGVTRPGIDGNGNQKTNQDTLLSLTNINKIKDFNIFGVLDGHGPDGHHVSNFASDFIPSQIINHPEIKKLSDPELIYQKLKENNCQIITESFLYCDEELKKAEFDAYSSGSTCILIIHIGVHILCANVGDSRAIVAYDDNKDDQELNYLEHAQLSIDYKPDLEDEKNRILLSGGVVEQMENQFGEGVGPFRVWAKGQNYPGLAMSRSIGDLKGKSIGVIAEPGILEYDINETTKFIVIASDGVWEFMKNENVIEIGKNFYIDNDTSNICHKIVDTSASIWQSRDVVMDDITVVVMFF